MEGVKLDEEVVCRPLDSPDVKGIVMSPPIFSTRASSFPIRRRSSWSLDLEFLTPCRPLGTRIRFGNTQSVPERLQAEHGLDLSHLIFRCRQCVQLRGLRSD